MQGWQILKVFNFSFGLFRFSYGMEINHCKAFTLCFERCQIRFPVEKKCIFSPWQPGFAQQFYFVFFPQKKLHCPHASHRAGVAKPPSRGEPGIGWGSSFEEVRKEVEKMSSAG